MKQFIKDNTEVLPKINRDITMNDNIKTSLGLLFPFSSIALFVYFCIIGSFLAAILAAVGGVMFWYLYSVVKLLKCIHLSFCFINDPQHEMN